MTLKATTHLKQNVDHTKGHDHEDVSNSEHLNKKHCIVQRNDVMLFTLFSTKEYDAELKHLAKWLGSVEQHVFRETKGETQCCHKS